MHKYAFYGIVFLGLAFVLFSVSLLTNTSGIASPSSSQGNYIQKSVAETDMCYKFDVYMDRFCGSAYSRDELNNLLMNVFTSRTICKNSGLLTVYCYPIGSNGDNVKKILYSDQIVDLNTG